MSDLPPSTRGADERTPPKRTGQSGGVITSTSVTTAAGELDILGPGFAGGAFYSFQATGADVYIVFKNASSTPTISLTTGLKMFDGQRPEEFWLTADERFVEHVGTASGLLRWWRSSPNYRNRG